MFKSRKWSEYLTDKRFIRIAVAAAFAAITLIWISGVVDFSSYGEKDAQQYASQLHEQLLQALLWRERLLGSIVVEESN